jgi:glycosyltransferase involved in cell wall biosynthesis
MMNQSEGMPLRKVLFITYHFPPSAASGTFRILGFTRYLPEFGWQPVVVAPPRTPWEPVDPRLLNQISAETVCVRAPYGHGRLTKRIVRVVGHAYWLARALPCCLRVMREHHPAVVFTSGPPHEVHVLGWLLKRRFGIPWIADFRDPWVTDGKPRQRFSLYGRLEARFEPTVFRRADCIVANAPLACESYQRAYPHYRRKICSITNGYDPEAFAGRQSIFRGERAICIVHTGELYAGREPRPLLEALASLRRERFFDRYPVRMSFLGRHSELTYDLAAAITNLGLADVVELRGQVAYDEAIRQMVGSDILLMFDSAGRRIGVPAKLYEYLGTGRPILALAEADGDSARVLEKSGIAYRLASPLDSNSIAQGLTELVQGAAGGTLPQPHPDRLLQFCRQRLTGDLARIMDQCTNRTQSLLATHHVATR